MSKLGVIYASFWVSNEEVEGNDEEVLSKLT
jgi:hypothetical protein